MTAFAGTSLAYDNNGNLTTYQNGDTLVYDAWNRLVAVYNSTGLLIKAYQYDGLGRLITETDGTNTTDLYYSNNWQVIEERTGVTYPYLLSTGSNGTVSAEYVYSPVYVNAPIVWNKGTDGDGTLDRQLYYTSDANYDVTSVIDTGGTVQERVVYDAYGNASFYSSSWSPLGGDSLNIRPLWQGGWFDSAIGSYDFEHRWYNPQLMRWLTVDPTGYSDGLNDYLSFEDNPLTYVDAAGSQASKPTAVDLPGTNGIYLGQLEENSDPLTEDKIRPMIDPTFLKNGGYQFNTVLVGDSSKDYVQICIGQITEDGKPLGKHVVFDFFHSTLYKIAKEDLQQFHDINTLQCVTLTLIEYNAMYEVQDRAGAPATNFLTQITVGGQHINATALPSATIGNITSVAPRTANLGKFVAAYMYAFQYKRVNGTQLAQTLEIRNLSNLDYMRYDDSSSVASKDQPSLLGTTTSAGVPELFTKQLFSQ